MKQINELGLAQNAIISTMRLTEMKLQTASPVRSRLALLSTLAAACSREVTEIKNG